MRDDLSIDEQFKPVGCLIRCSPCSSPASRAGFTIYVAAARHVPFFKLAERVATLRNELIRSSPDSLSATLAALPSMSLVPLAPFSLAATAIGLAIICSH